MITAQEEKEDDDDVGEGYGDDFDFGDGGDDYDDMGFPILADVMGELEAVMEESRDFLGPPTDAAIVDYGRVAADEDAFLADCLAESESRAVEATPPASGIPPDPAAATTATPPTRPDPADDEGGDDASGVALFLSPDDHLACLRLLNDKWRTYTTTLRKNADEAVRHAVAIAAANEKEDRRGTDSSDSTTSSIDEQKMLWEEKLESLLDAQEAERDRLRRDAAMEREGRVADLRAEASAERDAVRGAAEEERVEYLTTSGADRAEAEASHGADMRACREEARKEIGEWQEKLDVAAAERSDLAAENAADVRALRTTTAEVKESWIEKLDDAADRRSEAVARHSSEVRHVRSNTRSEVESYQVKLEAVDEDKADLAATHGADMRAVRASARRDIQGWQEKLDVAEAGRSDLGRDQATEVRKAKTAARREAEEFAEKLSSAEQDRLELESKHSSEVCSHSHKGDTSSSSEIAKAASLLAEEIDSLLIIADFKGKKDHDHEGEAKDGSTDVGVDDGIESFYEKLNEHRQKLREAAARCTHATAEADIMAKQTMEIEAFGDSVEAKWDAYERKTEEELTDLMTRHSSEVKGLNDGQR